MTINFSVKEFALKLSQVASVINRQNSMPILSTVLINTFENYLILSASDGENWLSVKCNQTKSDKKSKFCVQAQLLLKSVKELDAEFAEFIVYEDKQVIKCDYKNGFFSLPYETADCYPQKPVKSNSVNITLGAKKFVRAINKVRFTAGTSELRPIINGVYFELSKDGMTSVATNGTTIGKYSDNTEGYNLDNVHFVLANKAADVVTSVVSSDSDIIIEYGEKNTVIKSDDFSLTTRLIEGNYPNYNAVIPNAFNFSVVLDKLSLIKSIKRVLPMSNFELASVMFTFSKDKLCISTEDLDYSKSAKEEIFIENTNNDFQICFDGTKILSMLQNTDGENVEIAFTRSDGISAIKPHIEDGNTKTLLLTMPLRI